MVDCYPIASFQFQIISYRSVKAFIGNFLGATLGEANDATHLLRGHTVVEFQFNRGSYWSIYRFRKLSMVQIKKCPISMPDAAKLERVLKEYFISACTIIISLHSLEA